MTKSWSIQWTAVGLSLYEEMFETAALAPREIVETLLEASASLSDSNFSITFLLAEWGEWWTPGSCRRGKSTATSPV